MDRPSHRRHDITWALLGAFAACVALIIGVFTIFYQATGGNAAAIRLAGYAAGVATADLLFWPLVIFTLLIVVALLIGLLVMAVT